jgi:Na+/proline symporter
MILIGFFVEENKNMIDFFLANRTLGPWVFAFAYGGLV